MSDKSEDTMISLSEHLTEVPFRTSTQPQSVLSPGFLNYLNVIKKEKEEILGKNIPQKDINPIKQFGPNKTIH